MVWPRIRSTLMDNVHYKPVWKMLKQNALSHEWQFLSTVA